MAARRIFSIFSGSTGRGWYFLTLILWKKNRSAREVKSHDETKNGKARQVSIPPSVVGVLRAQQSWQSACRLQMGGEWENTRNLVFTNEKGRHLVHTTVYRHFKKAAAKIGMDQTRFHDLRHSFAINALQAGDNPKLVSEALGHYSSSFTLDTYAAVSQTMRKESQERMEDFFQSVTA